LFTEDKLKNAPVQSANAVKSVRGKIWLFCKLWFVGGLAKVPNVRRGFLHFPLPFGSATLTA
jgi:hypothetical protein